MKGTTNLFRFKKELAYAKGSILLDINRNGCTGERERVWMIPVPPILTARLSFRHSVRFICQPVFFFGGRTASTFEQPQSPGRKLLTTSYDVGSQLPKVTSTDICPIIDVIAPWANQIGDMCAWHAMWGNLCAMVKQPDCATATLYSVHGCG